MDYSEGKLRGYLYVILAAFCWANVAIFGRFLMKAGMSPYAVVFWRALFACLIAGFYLAFSGKNPFDGIERKDFVFYFLLGIAGIGFNYLGYLSAIRYVKIATALLMLYTFPSLVVLLARVFLKERITGRKLISLSLSMLGIVILLGWNISFSLIGYAWGFLSAVGNAAYALIGRRFSGKVDSFKTLFWGFFFGTVFLFLVMASVEGVSLPEASDFKYIIGLSFISTFLPYMFFLLSFKYLEAGKASIASLSEIPITSTLAFIFFSEKPGWNHFLGGGLIILSILFLIKGGD